MYALRFKYTGSLLQTRWETEVEVRYWEMVYGSNFEAVVREEDTWRKI